MMDQPEQAIYVLQFGTNVGLKYLDLWLLCSCPIASALGISVSTVLNKGSSDIQIESSRLHHWVGRVFIGAVLGIVVALYFVGAITDNLTSFARILALCILLGYQAPNIWFSQEKVIAGIIVKKLKNLENINKLTSKKET